jgi:hypothetical protein
MYVHAYACICTYTRLYVFDVGYGGYATYEMATKYKQEEREEEEAMHDVIVRAHTSGSMKDLPKMESL